jgi:hypothetical protein
MDLANIEIRSGVNEDGEPFCTVVATSSDGRIMLGQMTPDEVRQHGLGYLEAAEGADQDAAVLRVMRRLGQGGDLGHDGAEQFAAAVVMELRGMRNQGGS